MDENVRIRDEYCLLIRRIESIEMKPRGEWIYVKWWGKTLENKKKKKQNEMQTKHIYTKYFLWFASSARLDEIESDTMRERPIHK